MILIGLAFGPGSSDPVQGSSSGEHGWGEAGKISRSQCYKTFLQLSFLNTPDKL